MPPLRLPPHLQMQMPEPPERAPAPRGYSFRLWPKAKPHPARVRLLGPAASAAERAHETERQAQDDAKNTAGPPPAPNSTPATRVRFQAERSAS